MKLEEGTYFLDQAHTNQNRWKFFNFNFNVFSSAHSVTEMMQKEFEKSLKDPRDFYKWSKQAREKLDDQFPAEFREKLRRDGIHVEGNIR